MKLSPMAMGELRKLMAVVVLFGGALLLIGPVGVLSELISVGRTYSDSLLIGLPFTALVFLASAMIWAGYSLQGGALGVFVGLFVVFSNRGIGYFSDYGLGIAWLMILAASIITISLRFLRLEVH